MLLAHARGPMWPSAQALIEGGSHSAGRLKCPLPYPAAGSYVHPVSPDVLPWRPQPLQVAIPRQPLDTPPDHEQHLTPHAACRDLTSPTTVSLQPQGCLMGAFMAQVIILGPMANCSCSPLVASRSRGRHGACHALAVMCA
jgi:hypothetical protein